jgi:hypothetical protein
MPSDLAADRRRRPLECARNRANRLVGGEPTTDLLAVGAGQRSRGATTWCPRDPTLHG